MELFAGSNFRESNVASAVLTYCPNCSRDLFFANRKWFAKFEKIRSSRKFSRLEYVIFSILPTAQCQEFSAILVLVKNV
ncbi:MAG: hypothetical protein PV344_05735 [Anaplasma sp.]|nr:hypothetical protein [Anaplasma sp.]